MHSFMNVVLTMYIARGWSLYQVFLNVLLTVGPPNPENFFWLNAILR